MADRRKQQNFQQIPFYLTPALWSTLESQSREKAKTALLQHCWQLGMRCPSEPTFNVLQTLLRLTDGDRKPQSSFELYQGLGSLKKQWKTYKQARRGEDMVYGEYLETLPENPRDLPAEYYLAAFNREEFVEPRFLASLPWRNCLKSILG